MSEKKTILFNDTLTSNNKTKKRENRTRKEKPKQVIKPNSLKKTLLEKIKKHQQNEKISNLSKSDTNIIPNEKKDSAVDKEFHNNFMDSLDYLNNLNKKRKEQKQNKKLNKTKKKHTGGNNQTVPSFKTSFSEPLVEVNLPDDFDNAVSNNNIDYNKPLVIVENTPEIHTNIPHITVPTSSVTTNTVPISNERMNNTQMNTLPNTSTTVPYGCLKGGNKPTYREYHNKTLKKKHRINNLSSNSINNNSNNNKINSDLSRSEKLAKLKNSYNKSYKKLKLKKRKTKKSTYHLGKSKKSNIISVLIKNNNTRRKIKKEHGLLKQKSIKEIKNYLYEKNMIKIGSTAPNDVLRTLYEQSILAGDVTNTSTNIKLHNYLNTNDSQ